MNELNLNFEMVRVAKCKTTDAVNKCENEHNRVGEYAERHNVDPTLSTSNYSITNFKGSQMEIFEKQKELYNKTHKRKLRKDAVKALDGVFMVSKTDKEKDFIAFTKSCAQFLGEFFPDCPVKLWIHKDEKELHGHYMVCPINSDGQCITDSVMRKNNLRQMQTRFAEICQENGMKDVVRGLSKQDRFEKGLPQNYHKSNWQWAQEQELKEKEAQRKLEEAERNAKTAEIRQKNAENAEKTARENVELAEKRLRKLKKDTNDEIQLKLNIQDDIEELRTQYKKEKEQYEKDKEQFNKNHLGRINAEDFENFMNLIPQYEEEQGIERT